MMDLHIEEETYMKYYIGIDLGGTNIVAGVVNESYEILAKASVKTNLPRPEEEIAADMAKVSQEAAERLKEHMQEIWKKDGNFMVLKLWRTSSGLA